MNKKQKLLKILNSPAIPRENVMIADKIMKLFETNSLEEYERGFLMGKLEGKNEEIKNIKEIFNKINPETLEEEARTRQEEANKEDCLAEEMARERRNEIDKAKADERERTDGTREQD